MFATASSMEELGEVVSTTVTQVVESVVSVAASVSHVMVIVTTALTALVTQSMSLVEVLLPLLGCGNIYYQEMGSL